MVKSEGTTGRLARALGILVVLVSGGALNCAGDSNVKAGMTEGKAREILGEPSWVLTDQARVRAYLVGESCAASATKLLDDRVWFRSDVFVGVDASSHVVCRVGGRVIEH